MPRTSSGTPCPPEPTYRGIFPNVAERKPRAAGSTPTAHEVPVPIGSSRPPCQLGPDRYCPGGRRRGGGGWGSGDPPDRRARPVDLLVHQRTRGARSPEHPRECNGLPGGQGRRWPGEGHEYGSTTMAARSSARSGQSSRSFQQVDGSAFDGGQAEFLGGRERLAEQPAGPFGGAGVARGG